MPLTVELKTSCWLLTFVLSDRSDRISPKRTGLPLSEYKRLLLIPLIKDSSSLIIQLVVLEQNF